MILVIFPSLFACLSLPTLYTGISRMTSHPRVLETVPILAVKAPHSGKSFSPRKTRMICYPHSLYHYISSLSNQLKKSNICSSIFFFVLL